MLPNLSRLLLRDDAATGVTVEVRRQLAKYQGRWPQMESESPAAYDLRLLVEVLEEKFGSFGDDRVDSAIMHYIDIAHDAFTLYKMNANGVTYKRIHIAYRSKLVRDQGLEEAKKWLAWFDLWQKEGDEPMPMEIHGGGKAKIPDQTSKRQKDPQKYAISAAIAAKEAEYRELVAREDQLRDFSGIEL